LDRKAGQSISFNFLENKVNVLGRFDPYLLNLRSLDLSNIELYVEYDRRDRRHDVSWLTQLTELDISGNSRLYSTYLCQLTNLTYVNLKNAYVSRLDYVSQLINLSMLNIKKNIINVRAFHRNVDNISSLSPLTNLRSLNLEDNSIAEYSEAIQILSDHLPNCKIFTKKFSKL
jgi:hypothetical protein